MTIVRLLVIRSTTVPTKWTFERQENGNFRIKAASGLYLRIEGQPGNGVRVVVGSTPYEWNIRDDPSVRRGIRLSVPGKSENIDLSDYGNSKPGNPVELWCGPGNAPNQHWRLQEMDE